LAPGECWNNFVSAGHDGFISDPFNSPHTMIVSLLLLTLKNHVQSQGIVKPRTDLPQLVHFILLKRCGAKLTTFICIRKILQIIKAFYLPTDAQQSCFKRILKFTPKELLHVSVQSPSPWSVLFELAKVIVIKLIS
jgi:hypothetical protein